ncbi:hypothetical protein LMJF_32_2470 [Leishmania major strain Friedlin]|uniref:Uncharacterized protein n=1 Tax=Leishmania major TaxID=5664 RepID=Q4Q528_LEIMA|nr:hypothetical protein LMJF_32_2470 [Leishmania major strain Friedlin]CAG9580383.1 hypothetical_protein_-_conserved [Leishmania major strain Friedlin]CAJ08774.1 hypothetical protein LMJF_32_2470 [Leishmania major strain Friedlin]|eukprot:XP_001685570.1 hypothetical protein LMJF_32_2470 [Leishmania major strain Friedlin]
MALPDDRPALCVRTHKNKSKMARRARPVAEPSVLGPLRLIMVVDPLRVHRSQQQLSAALVHFATHVSLALHELLPSRLWRSRQVPLQDSGL